MTQGSLRLSIPPYVINIDSTIPSVLECIKYLYSNHTFLSDESSIFVDFYIRIAKPFGLRRWYRPQVQFFFDGKAPFKPLPLSQAYPFFEWGLNWCIATHAYQYLIIHAAVVEKDGKAMILPGKPGAGKSTLCAALVCQGWRLLSDEMAVINLKHNELIPIVRPISLKNDSIEIITQLSSTVQFGPSFLDTNKGTVAHMKPPKQSVLKANETVRPAWIVFPDFVVGAHTVFRSLSKAQSVLKLAENSFNYNVLGGFGFEALCNLVEFSSSYQFKYSDLKEAVSFLNKLA